MNDVFPGDEYPGSIGATAMTKRTVTLSFPHPSAKHAGDDYRVEQIEQSIEFHPGQFLAEREVDDLCKRPGWKVVIRRSTR
jgi:hypothetical protein